MSARADQHAEILRAMAAEWRAHDELSEDMLELALRVHAARNQEGNK